MSEIDLKEYGRLEQQVERLTSDVEDLKAQIKSQNVKLDTIMQTLTEARGGWKTLMWVCGAAAALATGVQWVLTNVTIKH